MTLTAHSLVAAALLAKIPNPAIGLPLALASHFLLDKVPHWDLMTNKNKTKSEIARDTAFDIIFGFAGATAIFWLKGGLDPVYFFSGILLSQLPDLLEAPYVFPQFSNPISSGLYKIQHWVHDVLYDSRVDAPWGIITQLIVVALSLLWAFFL